MENWHLFVDESGPFLHRGEENVVTGLLLRENDAEAFRQVLELQVRRAFPLAPYPPHAAHLNQEVFYAAALALRRLSLPAEEPWALEACEAALGAIRSDAAPETAPFLQALGEGSLPGYNALVSCNRWLEASHPAAFRGLHGLQERDRRRLASLLADLGETYGPDHCFVVAAANHAETEAVSPEPAPDLYLQLLEALLERVVAILRSGEGGCRVVRVHAAARRMRRRRFLGDRLLDSPTLGELTGRAMAFPLLAPASFRVDSPLRFFVTPPEDANRAPDTHPGLVLADQLSNRLYGALRDEPTWQRLKGRAALRFSLPVEAVARALGGCGPLPTVASDGVAREAVHRAFAGETPPALAGLRPPWAGEQAQAWSRAALAQPVPERGAP